MDLALSTFSFFTVDLALRTFADRVTLSRAHRVITLPSALRVTLEKRGEKKREERRRKTRYITRREKRTKRRGRRRSRRRRRDEMLCCLKSRG